MDVEGSVATPVLGRVWTKARFDAADERRAPLTWGQRALWVALRRHGPGQVMISIRRTVPVPRRAHGGVDSVLRALGDLVARHSSLRTRLQEIDGERCQVVSAAGELPVLLVHGAEDDRDLTASVAAELASTPFDHERDLPQRVALTVVGGRVSHVVLVFSHTTVDFQAVEIVLRELRLLLLRGAVPGPPGLQSVDIADREQTDRHRRRGERSVAQWVTSYGRLPTDTLPWSGPPSRPRFQRAVLASAAADTAVRLVANQRRITSPTVLLAAVAAVCARWSGNDIVGVYTMCNNRSWDGYADAIAKLNQLALVVVDTADQPTFAALLPKAWQAALGAYRHSYYDPTLMAEAFAAAGHPYATGISPHCYLNDIRLSTDTDLFGRETGEEQVRAAAAGSTLTFTDGFDRFTWRARVEILDVPGGLGLGLTADSSYLSTEEVERFLRDLERLLVEAAFADVPWPWLPLR